MPMKKRTRKFIRKVVQASFPLTTAVIKARRSNKKASIARKDKGN